MPMKNKRWVVYFRRGVFAESIGKYPSEELAKKRLQQILKRDPAMRGKLGIYCTKLTTNNRQLTKVKP